MAKRKEDAGTGRHADTTGVRSGANRRLVLVVCAVVLALAAAGTWHALRTDTVAAAMNFGRYDIARRLLREAAGKGDAVAQNTLGNLYYLGLGGPVDQRAASRMYLAAALQNNADAQINVARHYALGLGLPKDILRAFAWLDHARKNGKEIATGHMMLLVGGVSTTPNYLEQVRKHYPNVEDLRPEGDAR